MSKTRKAEYMPIERPKRWGRPSTGRELPRPWYGLDTERDSGDGRFVCGFAVNNEEALRYEMLGELPAGTYWIWNLPYDIEGGIRDYRREEGWAMRADAADFELMPGATCRYYHGKRFDFKDYLGRRTFLEASSFFGRKSLRTIAEKILGDTKDDIDASEMSYDRYWNDEDYREAVDRYCQKDALLVLRLMERLNRGFLETGERLSRLWGAERKTPIGSTPGATARRFLGFLGQMPPIVWRTHRAFLRCYGGGRFELTKLGYLEDVYQYDIVSGYPHALRRAPFLTESAWQRHSRRCSDEALYGSYRVRFSTDEYLGLAPTWRGDTRVYSKGEESVWLTKLEVDWLQDHGYDYEIMEGCEVFDENATNAWARLIEPAFSLKEDNPGTDLALGAKAKLVSVYGVMIQLTPHAGQWVPKGTAEAPIDFRGGLELAPGRPGFNAGEYYAPIYASFITAHCRLQLLEAARSVAPESYIGGHTDSVLTTEPLRTGLGEGLGDWKLERTAKEFVITKTGVYAMDGYIKNRGCGKVGDRSVLWADTQMRKCRTGVKLAKNWEEVSLIREVPMRNNVGIDRKRDWNRKFSARTIRRKKFVDSEALRNVGQQ